LILVTAACSQHADTQIPDTQIPIPRELGWTDEGTVLEKGSPGSWDVSLGGAISPGAMIKKNGTYFLYYIGADGDRSTDGGPRHRALGVAISSDGINFNKYAGNPILTFLPHNNEEEGIFSVAAMIDDTGEVLLYYGAMDAGSSTSTFVTSNVRLAVSNNGLQFTEVGDILLHENSLVWGYSDELFPVGAFRFENTYYVYYIAKGKGAYWDLGLAWGSDKHKLTNSQAVIKSGDWIVGGCDAVQLSNNKIALFIVRTPNWKKFYVEVRTASMEIPFNLGVSKGLYDVEDHALVYYDKESAKWFMYYHDRYGNIGVRSALIDSSIE